jgi:hypothetical protein
MRNFFPFIPFSVREQRSLYSSPRRLTPADLAREFMPDEFVRPGAVM